MLKYLMQRKFHFFFTLAVIFILYALTSTNAFANILKFQYTPYFFKIESVRLDIKIKDDLTHVHIEYVINNLTKGDTSLNIKFLQPLGFTDKSSGSKKSSNEMFDKKVNFAFGEKKTVSVTYKIPTMRNKSFRLVKVDPTVILNNHIYAEKIIQYSIAAHFPTSAKKLIRCSHDKPINFNDHRRNVKWSGKNVYTLPFSAKWTEKDVNVDIRKSISISGNRGTVSLVIINKTKKVIKDFTLQDSFFPGNVQPIGPKEEFYLLDQKNSDPRYYWKKKIFKLSPKTPLEFQYQIQFIYPFGFLPGTIGLLDSSIVAISNDVKFNPIPLPIVKTKVSTFTVPTGWYFDYKGKGVDHHLNELSYTIGSQSFNSDSNKLSWNANVTYCDKNKDDKYKWDVKHTIFRLENAFVNSGSVEWINCGGGTSSHNGNYNSENLRGFDNAVVLLLGCHFDYKKKDHHIKTVGIKIKDINYNSVNGTISWKAEAIYRDKNKDDDYRWKYWYQIIAFNNGFIGYKHDIKVKVNEGGKAVDANSFDDETLKGTVYSTIMPIAVPQYKSDEVAVIPIGWSYKYKKKDGHIDQIGLNIRNILHTASEVKGFVNWKAHLNFSDKNADDSYEGKYSVAILAIKKSKIRRLDEVQPGGPYEDNGGSAKKSYNVDLNRVFAPITWYNGKLDGTEEGIDCGGDAPIQCMDCLNDFSQGSGASSDYYSFYNSFIDSVANEALINYVLHKGEDPAVFYSGVEQADRYVEAVAWFVEENMEYMDDPGYFDSWWGAQSAGATVMSSGERGCGFDFCGDCEDFSILRATLLRRLGFSWKCIFSADHHSNEDQGQTQECPIKKSKNSYGHTFNIVYYKGKFRILDYKEMKPRNYSGCSESRTTDNVWNDHYGKYWDKWKLRPYDGRLLMNYPGYSNCPSSSWDWRNYYNDICQ